MGWSRNVKSIGKQLKAGIQWKDNSERSAISDTDYCSTSTAYPLAILRSRIALRSFPRVSRKFCLVKKKKVFLSRGFVERRLRIPKSLNASLLLDYRRTPRELQSSTSSPKEEYPYFIRAYKIFNNIQRRGTWTNLFMWYYYRLLETCLLFWNMGYLMLIVYYMT